MSVYLISIIMPTYNSERTLEASLKSIREQSIESEKVEILIVDGGSTDKTCEIAQKYGATILNNPQRLPEYAKQIGLFSAKGKYGIFIDSDEAFLNIDSLRMRINSFEKYPKVKNLVSTGQKCISGEGGVNRYANYIGDPFSNFVYRFNGYDRKEDILKTYSYVEFEEGYVIDFHQAKYLPLFDALGNMFEVETAREVYEKHGKSKSFAANIFSEMVQETQKAIILKEDYIQHTPGLTRNIYLQKIKWRIKNNLFQTEGVGFAERSKKEKGLQKRKLLFIPYCLFVIPVIWDSLNISIKNRDWYFLTHFLYTEYTFILIVWYVILKILHFPVRMEKTYGKK